MHGRAGLGAHNSVPYHIISRWLAAVSVCTMNGQILKRKVQGVVHNTTACLHLIMCFTVTWLYTIHGLRMRCVAFVFAGQLMSVSDLTLWFS